MSLPAFTKTWHNTSYDAISPKNPALSAKGKNIIITGGGNGIGAEMARSFAVAGAANVAILGRNEAKLQSTKAAIEKEFPNTHVFAAAADILDKAAIDRTFDAIKAHVGPANVLISNAGYLPDIKSIAESDIDQWWSGMEINVRGPLIVVQSFLRIAAPDATIISVGTGGAQMPHFPGYSSYAASKFAAWKFFEYLHHEQPEMTVISMHPGVLATDMGNKSIAAGTELPLDEMSLPADFAVFVASPEARFLNGKFVWSNWDVEEMKARREEITSTAVLTTNNFGVDFTGGSA